MNAPARRRRRLARTLKPAGLDALLVTNPLNVTYLTGFTGDSSFLLLGPKRSVLVSDGRYTQQIAEECPDLETSIRPPDRTVWQQAAEAVGKLGWRKVGFESKHVTVGDLETLRELLPSADWAAQKPVVEPLRMVKDVGEVEQIRAAIRAAERAFAMFRATLRPADTEKELADALDGYVRRAGGRWSAFPPIVAVGDRSALPHAPPTARRVEESPVLLVDWGADVGGYHSDLTRVAAVPGANPPRGPRQAVESKLEKLYSIVLAAQKAARQAVRPGVEAKAVDAAARRVIEQAGYGPQFSHGLGHGIGLQIHEGPFLRANSADVLEAGMVFTLEPGVYLPGVCGVRVEDDVLVTPDGCEVLTHVERDPAALLGKM